MLLDHARYDFTRQRPRGDRSRRLVLVVVAFAVLVASAAVLRVDRWIAGLFSRAPELTLLQLSNAGRYAEVNERAAVVLANDPLDTNTLLFDGIAHFYGAIAEGGAELRVARLDAAIRSLRRAMLNEGLAHTAEVEYLLGRAYFQKGRYYYDLSVKYLSQSLEKGYEGADTHEYLGMAYLRLEQMPDALRHFEVALAQQPSDLLYLSVGQIYRSLGESAAATTALRTAVELTGDQSLELQARFLLGELYLETQAHAEAAEQFTRILELAPQSADAHVFLGDAYLGSGDPVAARAEWRRARNIDVNHHGADLRLRP
jgi:tetratricopeptide (TPR) repeat protein